MWKRLVVVSCLIGCGSSSSSKSTTEPMSNAKTVEIVRVDDAKVLETVGDEPPPVMVVLDAQGVMRLAAAESWAKAADATFDARAVERSLLPIIRMYAGSRTSPSQIVEELANRPRTDLRDDPPPPEEEDMPDDGWDESGGTGTAMALDEGKMGSDRAEGQYKMRKESTDQAGALRDEMQAITGAPGRHRVERAPTDAVARLASIVGEVPVDGRFRKEQVALVVAAPTTNAMLVIQVIGELEASIAVLHKGVVRPLRVRFLGDYTAKNFEPKHWLEARVTATSLAIQAVPDRPIEVPWKTGSALDHDAVADALYRARTARKLDPRTTVDILVENSVDAQRLIDTIVAVDRAGVPVIGLGNAPAAGTDEAAKRGHRTR